MVRAVARFDYEAAGRIQHWPLVELLHAYQHILRDHEARNYRHRLLVWTIGTTRMLGKGQKHSKPPTVPGILKDDADS